MSNDNQSQGRKDNAASPVDDWESKGVADRKQKDDAERTGRTAEVAGEDKTFSADGIPDAHDLTGPAGDPAEGKRPGGSSWPA